MKTYYRWLAILVGWYCAMATPILTSDLLALPPLVLLTWWAVGTFGVALVGLAAYDLGRGSKR